MSNAWTLTHVSYICICKYWCLNSCVCTWGLGKLNLVPKHLCQTGCFTDRVQNCYPVLNCWVVEYCVFFSYSCIVSKSFTHSSFRVHCRMAEGITLLEITVEPTRGINEVIKDAYDAVQHGLRKAHAKKFHAFKVL